MEFIPDVPPALLEQLYKNLLPRLKKEIRQLESNPN